MRNIVRAKKALIIVARDQGYSMPTIAKAVNNDHSTISHHLSTARSQLQTDVLMQQYVDKLRTVIDADYAERQRIVLEVSAAARQMRDEALRARVAVGIVGFAGTLIYRDQSGGLQMNGLETMLAMCGLMAALLVVQTMMVRFILKVQASPGG